MLIPLEKRLFIRLKYVDIGQTELETTGIFNIEKKYPISWICE